ncbi:hypothetical protein [Saccharothrix obliqua]|uniref:hypothetical protein n=1 Tax=Saccharothrix obliqua TaxID=2861747 RepID=UPI001C5CC8C0|nr:hypothetical protein [Saccharothrix obliqua]MBW4715617.1 hypothetical protein [Saccharothrix obliqua]
MNLFGTDTLIIEQPWGTGRHLLGTRYRVDVHSEHDVPLASVRDRRGLGPLRALLRTTGFSGRTAFDLEVAHLGQPLLLVRKGAGKPPTRVSRPDGTPLGALHKESRTHYALLDPTGQRLCYFGDVAAFTQGAIARRDGGRVRRDVLRLRPGAPEPARALAVALGLVFDVVRGVGTNHTGGGGFDFSVG